MATKKTTKKPAKHPLVKAVFGNMKKLPAKKTTATPIEQVQIACEQLVGPTVQPTGERDHHGRFISLPGVPQFLRDAALARSPLSTDEMLREIRRPRQWVMPNKNAPKAESMASIMSKYEVSDPAAPVSVQVALADKTGSTSLATYDNWEAFKAGHDATTYPIKKTATLEGTTVVIVRATPWAGREKTERKPREGKSKKDIVGDLLLRAEGCTTKDILEATGWPAVSVPAQATAVGLKLRKEKVDGVTRYWGSK